MRNRMYGGVRGRKTKVGGNYFVFLLLDLNGVYGNCLLQFLVTIHGEVAQFFLDAEELVVLGHAVGAAQGTGLDLAAVGGHGDVGDGGILGLT